MRADIRSVIREQQISVRFQPIIDLRARTLLSYEALSRGPADGPLHAPLALFAAASEAGLLPELELACLTVAVRTAGALHYRGRLFLNMSPHSLVAGLDWPAELESLCARHGIEPGACVLELTEQTLIQDFAAVKGTLASLRDAGFDLAIDDFGTGHSGLRMWSELRPDFVKIDRYFVNGIDADPIKLEFVRSIVDMARAVGSSVIAEGIETLAECREVFELDVEGAQGYLFGRPEATLCDPATALATLAQLRAPEAAATAGQLIVETPHVEPTMRVSEFVRLVQEQTHCTAFPVVDAQGIPLGMIWRDRFLVNYSKPLHPEVLAKKSVTTIMDPTPLVIDSRLRLEQASRLVTRKSRMQITDQFIITRDERYAGIGYTIDLLTHITEQRVQAAAHSNPLTALPGNFPITDNINRILQQGRPFVICYVDLDYFKPFNDHYGYARGDQVLLQLAQLLSGAVSRRSDFVGHIGGDDFVMILRSPDWAARLVRLVEAFTATARNFYSPEDLAAGGIETIDRYGTKRSFGLLTLSVAIIDSRLRSFQSASEVSETLQSAKRRSKAIEGNSLWYEGPDGGRDLLADPGAILSAAALPPESSRVEPGEPAAPEEPALARRVAS